MAYFGVTIEEIGSISPIDGADKIEKATLKNVDFQFVVPKGIYSIGEQVVYFPIDSVLPPKLVEVLGLTGKLSGKNSDRVKTIRLRGELSQGIVAKVATINENFPGFVSTSEDKNTAGEEFAKFLGVIKYEVPAILCKDANLLPLPLGLSAYDIEGCERYPHIISLLNEVVISEKVEGCLEENTIIETLEYGDLTIKQITELKNKDCHVKSYDFDSKQICFKKVEGTSIKANIDNWYEIEIEDGTKIQITGNHRVWLPELNCWRKVEDLEENNKILFD